MKAFVLCAGKGERLRPFTDHLAKPAIPFLNIPMMYYTIWTLKNLGIGDFLLNTHHLPGSIEAALQNCPDKKLHFKTYFEPALLGSGGPLAKARGEFTSEAPFLLVNGDTIFFLHNKQVLQDFYNFHVAKKAMASILLIPHTEKTKSFGSVWIDAKNQVTGFGKTPPKNGGHADPEHFIGLILMSKKCLDWFEEKESNIFYDVFTPHLNEQKIFGYVSKDITWFETGNINDYWSAMTTMHAVLTKKPATATEAFMQKNFQAMLNEFFPDAKLADRMPIEVPKNIEELLKANKDLIT